MKVSLLALSLLAVVIGTSCDRRDDPENAPTPEAAVTDAAPVPATDPTLPVATKADASPDAVAPDDSLALGLLVAIDDNQIKAAQQAVAMKVSAPVMDYARKMEQEHTDNLVATKALGAQAGTTEVQALRERGATDLAERGGKSGEEYEKAYVDAMVKSHTEELALIDGRLLSLASAGPVRDHISRTRDSVTMHLQAAKQLQATP